MSGSEQALWLLVGILVLFLSYSVYLVLRIKHLDASIRLHEAMLAEEQRAKGLTAAE